MNAMTFGSMLFLGDNLPAPTAAHMGCDTRAFMQDLYRSGREPNLDRFLHQVVGNAVQVRIEGHMIVDVDAGPGTIRSDRTAP